MRYSDPVGYLITFACYGTRVHGDARGTVHHDQTGFARPTVQPDPEVERVMRERMAQAPFTLDYKARFVADKTIREVFQYRKWKLGQLNVRTNHVHIVAAVNVRGDAKAWAARRLRESGLVAADRRIWADGGSTVYLWNAASWAEAMEYVSDRQGPDLPMRAG